MRGGGGGGGQRSKQARGRERGRGREGPIYGVERERGGEKGGRVGKGGRKTTKGKGVKDNGTVVFLLIGF